MSLAVVIKNLILFVLIILIGHFLVKNYLLDKHAPSTTPSKPSSSIPEKSTSQLPPSLAQPLKSGVGEGLPVVDKPQDSKPLTEPQGLDKAKEELLKFVDDEEESVNMSKYFSCTTTLPPVPTDDCKSKVQVSQFPLSTTCDANIQIVSKEPIKKDISHCAVSSTNVVLLNEYENEKPMNGGALYGGLSGFDSFDNHYSFLGA